MRFFTDQNGLTAMESMSCLPPPRKWLFGSGWRTKQYRLLVTLGCLLPRKVWWAVWISSFWPKNEVFYRPEWTNGGTTWKWILSIFKFRSEYYKQIGKGRWKKFVYFPCSLPVLWSLNFALTSARNLSRLKQFTYMHLKSLVTNFQKLMFFLFFFIWK